MQALTGQIDEHGLLARLDADWPAAVGGAPFVVSPQTPDWQCVLRRIDDRSSQYLAILRLSARLQAPNEAFTTIVENLPHTVTRHDRDFRCTYANPAIEEMTGIKAAEHIAKDHRVFALPLELVPDFVRIYRRVFERGKAVNADFEYPGPRGLRHYQAHMMPEYDHQGRVQSALSIIRDMTEFKQLQEQLELLANTDPLTSLLNRRGFLENVDAVLDRVRHGQGELSLLMFDVDNMKFINDRFGHVVGDRVLEAVGQILLTETRAQDLVARLGGDEFAIALIDTNAAKAQAVAKRLRRRVGEIRDDDDGQPIGASVSIGVAQARITDASASDLLARVDELMYRKKSRVRSRT